MTETSSRYVECHERRLCLAQPVVMGILNLTPDSFSDGGVNDTVDAALSAAHAMLEAGAAVIDLGAESTRPGAPAVAAETQLKRLLPVLTRLRADTDAFLSVDTGDAEVIRSVVEAGVDMINDVYALRQPGAVEAVSDSKVGVCLMHMQGSPADMQTDPRYAALPGDIVDFLHERLEVCRNAGIAAERIVVDPGFGFGKTDAHNLQILSRLEDFLALRRPLLVGLSRKSTLGRLTGRDTSERLAAGVAAAVLAVERGAAIVRTHDVPATVDALKIVAGLKSAGAA